jgi:DNA end-binding protein Ku
MARSMWKGAISFGLITIPVRLYTATESESAVRFNMLHSTDLSRVQMKTWCPVEDVAISRSDTVKGYEYATGRYVVVSDEDIDRLPLKTMRTIEIEQFTPRAEIGPRLGLAKAAYYLEPDKVGRRAFALLRRVLAEKALTAVCKVVIRDREALAVLDPFEDTMMLTTLHWPDEVRSTGELDLGDEAFEFKPAEVAIAQQLADAMTAPFEPGRYRDEYRDALMAMIEAKVAGQQVDEPAVEEGSGNLVDLMKLLEASVKAQVGAREAAAGAPTSLATAKAKRAAKSKAAAAEGETVTASGRKARTAKPAAPAEPEPVAEAAAATRPARRRRAS